MDDHEEVSYIMGYFFSKLMRGTHTVRKLSSVATGNCLYRTTIQYYRRNHSTLLDLNLVMTHI